MPVAPSAGSPRRSPPSFPLHPRRRRRAAGEDRRPQRHVGALRRLPGPGLGHRGATRHRGLCETGRAAGRAGLRRPPEQDRYRRLDRPALVRPGRRRPDRRRAELRRGAGRREPGAGEEQGVHRLGRRHRRAHRQAMLAQHRALDLRHLVARPCPGEGAGAAGRQILVLPHRRLHLRQGPRRLGRRGGEGDGRQHEGGVAPSARHLRLLVLPAPGARLGRRRDRAPMPATTPRTPSSRRRNSASPRASASPG